MWPLSFSESFYLLLSLFLVGLGVFVFCRAIREKARGDQLRNYLVMGGSSMLFGIYNFLISLDVL